MKRDHICETPYCEAQWSIEHWDQCRHRRRAAAAGGSSGLPSIAVPRRDGGHASQIRT